MMTSPDAADPSPRTRHPGRLIGRILFVIVASALVLAVTAALVLVWTIQRSFPQTSGELTLDALDAPVTVQRDALGVPTVTARTATDLFAAQGFVHAQDRFWEMDVRRHTTSGRLSEMFGASQVGTDSFLRTLGWHRTAEQELEAMDDITRGYYEAYATGVNAYLETRSGAELSLEYAALGITNPDYAPEPWQPADSVAWLKAMAWDLRSNIGDETARALLAGETDQATIEQLYPGFPFDRNPVIVPVISELGTPSATPAPAPAEADQEPGAEGETEQSGEVEAGTADGTPSWRETEDPLQAAGLLLGDALEGLGSNSWVVSGALTETGLPLLANDPHLGSSLPSVWHQMQLRCAEVTEECPFDVGGFSFSGLPGIIIGHNADIAWGFTNLPADVSDLYIEKIDGDDVWRDGSRVPLDIRTETIAVAGGDDVSLTVRTTPHGPIVSGLTPDFTALAETPRVADSAGRVSAPMDGLTGEYAVSLRWTALDPGTTAEAIFALNTAADFTDFRAAASLFDVPAQNLVYADTEGNIGYQSPGTLPIRGGGDGAFPQPGWDSRFDWSGSIPFEALPVSFNPASGYIVTANNAVVDESYRYPLGVDWDHGYRAARIVYLIERISATRALTAQDMRDIQYDNEMWIGDRLSSAVGDLEVSHDGTATALAQLRSWNAQNSLDSAPAAYANVLWARLLHNLFTEREDPLPLPGQARLFTVVNALLADPDDPLWTNDQIDVSGQDEMLALSAEQAYTELAAIQGEDPAGWSWGRLHALTLTHQTLGTSGIAPIEALFNRGPYPAAGGASVVNATGWPSGGPYATTTVPSMRMVIDLSDFDASTWNQLTGVSGHACHPHYTDQTESWSRGLQSPWPFSADAVDQATTDSLRLVPSR